MYEHLWSHLWKAILWWYVNSSYASNLQLKALGIDNILGFDWPASPSPEAMVRALEVLYSLGVLDDDAKLTSPAGFQVAEIPLVCCMCKNLTAVLYFEPVSISHVIFFSVP